MNGDKLAYCGMVLKGLIPQAPVCRGSPYSLCKCPLEVILVHLQVLAAFAGLLPMIATATGRNAPINAKCSNRIVASYVAE